MSLLTPGIGLIFWMTLTFAIVLFILGKWGWPVIIKTLKQREEDIKQSLLLADKAKQDMAQLQDNNEKLLAQTKQEQAKILLEAKQTADQIVSSAKQKAKQEADKIILQAKETINFERDKVVSSLKEEVSDIALQIAQKVLEQEVKDPKVTEQIIAKQLDEIKFK